MAVLPRQFDHVCDQVVFVSSPLWHSTLGGPVLAQNPAYTTLRNLYLAAHMINAGPLLSYVYPGSHVMVEPLPGTSFMTGSGGGRTVPLLVIVDRA